MVAITRWQLLPISYGSLVTRHAKAPKGTFAIPHASGYQYDDYQLLKPLKQQAQELLDALAPPLNALWEQVYDLDDTPGVALASAEDWWAQAEWVLENTWWTQLRELQKEVGAPHYLQHTSQLAEVLPKAQAGLYQLRRFLAEVPPPDVAAKVDVSIDLTAGDGERYHVRHFVSPNVNSSGSFFASKFNSREPVGAPVDDTEGIVARTPAYPPVTLREQLLDIRERIDLVLSQLD